ncbi:MAG: TMEM165/GDT1 family protein [Polyangiaceae bacterium]|nr:TMEM165/GDT1 family protein [Polyangiaceae bacterium]MCW5789763.1 TMEM165/GDT1 family protein [Polyangiaceae bacterium]
MRGTWLARVWLALALVSILAYTGAAAATPNQVILPGREAEVLSLVQRALAAADVQLTPNEYGVRIEHDRIITRIRAASAVDLSLHAPGETSGDLTPEVSLTCFPEDTTLAMPGATSVPCPQAEAERWRPLAQALAKERAGSLHLWVGSHEGVATDPGPPTDVPLRHRVSYINFLGLAWLLVFGAFKLYAWVRGVGRHRTVSLHDGQRFTVSVGDDKRAGLKPAPTERQEEGSKPAPAERQTERQTEGSKPAPAEQQKEDLKPVTAERQTERSKPVPAERRGSISAVVIGLSLIALVTIAALGTAGMPLHEHLSYLARADCAHRLDCFEDPFGPGWSSTFFRSYGPLLHTFPYSVKNLCYQSLFVTALAVLAGQAYLREVLRVAGYGAPERRRAAALATAFICLNPIIIRVAIAGTPWPFVLLCLFGAGLALFQAQRSERRPARAAAYTAAVMLLALAVNTNYVMLTLLPLVVLAPLTSLPRGSARPSLSAFAWLGVAAITLTLLSAESLREGYLAASARGSGPPIEKVLDHPLLDSRLLPITLAPLCLGGLGVALWRRAGVPLVYAILATHPTLATYGGQPLAASYPVGFINAFFGLVLVSLLAGVGGMLLTRWLERRLPPRTTTLVVAIAVLAPLPLATEGLQFLRGSRVLERELQEITARLPTLPPHDLLQYAPLQEPLIPREELAADPIQVAFPIGEYLTRLPGQPVPCELGSPNCAPTSSEPKRVLLYVGSPYYSFVQREIERGKVPSSLERPSLTALRRTHRLTPVSTFKLSPEQHPLISSRLAADRREVELGFYWIEPK